MGMREKLLTGGVGAGAAFAIAFTGSQMMASPEAHAEAGVATDAGAGQLDLAIPADGGANCVQLVEEHGRKFYEGQGDPFVTGTGKRIIRFVAGAVDNTGHRLHTDGTNTPLEDVTTEGVQASICQDPAQAAQLLVAMFTDHAKIGDKTIGQVNEDWIPRDLQGKDGVNNINDWVAKAMTNDPAAHEEAQGVMSKAAALWGKLRQDGIQTKTTVANIHLPNAEGARVGGIPEFDWNTQQYEGKFFVGTYTIKAIGSVVCVGTNVGVDGVDGGDQRFALFSCDSKPVNPQPSRTATPSPTSVPETSTQTTPPSSGKQASLRPGAREVTVKACEPNQYLGRDGKCHAAAGSGESASATSGSTTEAAQGNSGAGATNTTKAPVTSTPGITISVTTVPTSTGIKP